MALKDSETLRVKIVRADDGRPTGGIRICPPESEPARRIEDMVLDPVHQDVLLRRIHCTRDAISNELEDAGVEDPFAAMERSRQAADARVREILSP